MGGLTLAAAGKALGGAALESGQGMLNTWFARRQQEKLMHAQSEEYFANAARAGATPAAIAAGVAGAAPSTVPSVSNLSAASPIGANMAAFENAKTQRDMTDSNIDINNMKLFFEPKKYQIDFMKTFAEVERMSWQNKADKALAEQMHEAAESLRYKRPWEIRTMVSGLQKMAAEIDLLKSQKTTTEKLGQLYDKQGNYYDAASENLWADTQNKGFEAFQQMYNNGLLALGINPTQKPWDNILTMAMYSPFKAQKVLNSIIDTLNRVDQKFQEGLGTHYKRNAALGLLGYKYLNGRQTRLNNRNMRFVNTMNAVSNFIPFAGGTPGLNILSPGFYTPY